MWTMKDYINFWMRTTTNAKVVAATSTSQIVFAANPRRLVLGWSDNQTNRMTIAFDKVAIDVQGLIIHQITIPGVLTLDTFGSLLQAQISVINSAAGPTNIFMWEVISNDT